MKTAANGKKMASVNAAMDQHNLTLRNAKVSVSGTEETCLTTNWVISFTAPFVSESKNLGKKMYSLLTLLVNKSVSPELLIFV